jgi:hypothetical protein
MISPLLLLVLAQYANPTCVSGCSDAPSNNYDYTPTYVDPEEEARREREAEEAREAARLRRIREEQEALAEAEAVVHAHQQLWDQGAKAAFRLGRVNEFRAQLERREQNVSGLVDSLAPLRDAPADTSAQPAAGGPPPLADYIRQLNDEERARQKELAAKVKAATPPPPPEAKPAPVPMGPAAFDQPPRVPSSTLLARLPSFEERRALFKAEAEKQAWKQWWKALE